MWCIHTNGLFITQPKREWSTDKCYNVDKPSKHYVKWKISQTYKVTYYTTPFIRIGQSVETESRLVVAGDWRTEK